MTEVGHLSTAPRPPVRKLHDLGGTSDAGGVSRHRRGSNFMFGFSFGLPRKCTAFSLTWRVSLRFGFHGLRG